ncbi:AraC family transcriptional regulator [Prosthecobacter sp.]|uniref:AraC family transcriptional regulator n=1 Tax=Prosthecobacter sp. TaxID=1965333 RepID=UPI00378517A0
MPATDQADYFSTQVVRTRRFFLPEWEGRQRDATALCLVGGGCEWCAPDFIVDRKAFPYLAFEFVSKGNGSVTLADQTHPIESGHAFIFDSTTPQVIRSSADEPMVKYFFNFTGARAVQLMRDLDLSPGTVLRVTDASRVISLLEEVIDHALRGGQFGLRAACSALEHALVLCADSRQSATTPIDPAYATYLRCRGHLLRNYPVLSSIEQAARACHVSAAYFTRLFQRYDTETPLACLTRLKLSQAAIKLRHPEALVKAVAAELGYKSAAHFSRAFKAWSGRSPRS